MKRRRFVALVSGLLVLGSCTDDSGSDRALPSPGPSQTATPSDELPDGPTNADYRAMAAAASRRTLAKTPIPDGAVRLKGKPPGWPKDYGISLGPSDTRLTRTGWWSVPMSTDALATFLASHEPNGMRHPPGEDVTTCNESFDVCDTTYSPIRQSRPEVYGGPTLLVQFAANGDRSWMRADTFTFARPVRPPESYLTETVTSVGIDRVVQSSRGLRNKRVPHVEVTDPDLIRLLVKAVNGLYGSHGFMSSCPFLGRPSPSLTLRFHTSSGIVRVQGERGCWDGLTVTRDGEQVGPDLDPEGIDEVVEKAIRKN